MEDYTMRPVRRPKASTAVTVIICVVFGLLAFIFAISSAALLSLRGILSGSVLSNAVSEIQPLDWEMGMFADEEQLDEVAKILQIPLDRLDEDSTVSDMICVTAAQYKLSISSFELEELLEQSEIMPAIGGLVGTYEHYLLTGEDEELFDRRQLLAEIKSHKSSIEKYTGVDLSVFYDNIEDNFRRNSAELKKFNPSKMTNDAGKYTSVALSLPVMIGCLALSVAMAVLALLITKRPVACLRMLGIVMTAAGAVVIAAALMIPSALKAALPMLGSRVLREITALINGAISPILLRNGFVFTAAGVLMIVISVLCAILVKKFGAKKEIPETQTVENA